jgi:hydrogenase maturation protease
MLVIAVGNRLRSDDGVAFAVAEDLRAREPGCIRIVHSDDVLSLMDEWTGQDVVVLIDAVQSGASAGTIHVIDATERPLPLTWACASSHQVELPHVIEIARQLDRLPAKLMVVGVEGASFDYGMHLSPQVAGAVPQASAAVLAYLPPRVV